MNKIIRQVLFTTIPFLLLLAACAPAPAPPPDQTLINSQVSTAVALTVASQNLDTAEAQPPATETALPTATVAVIDTPTLVVPLDTPTAIVLPTSTTSSGGGSTTGGGGGTTSSSGYSCEAINRRPYDNTSYKPGEKFDIKWTIHNNGTKTMLAGLDLKYSNGDKLMSNKTIELPELKPGAEYSVNFDAVAPDKAGNYVMVYMVEGGLCYPYTAIVVEK
jgi:hypothetical protein